SVRPTSSSRRRSRARRVTPPSACRSRTARRGSVSGSRASSSQRRAARRSRRRCSRPCSSALDAGSKRYPAPMHSPVNAHLGIETIDPEDGSVGLRLAAGPEHRNEVDLVHGGLVSFLLDGAMGRAVGLGLAQGGLCATVQLSVQFLAPARGTIVAV